MVRGRVVLPEERCEAELLKDIIFGHNTMPGFSKVMIVDDEQPSVIERLQEIALEKLGIRGAVLR